MSFKILSVSGLGLGGTERAACAWAVALSRKGHAVHHYSDTDGPRRAELSQQGIVSHRFNPSSEAISNLLKVLNTDVIHLHAPGSAGYAYSLFDAIDLSARKIPVLQTNVFGRLDNPREEPYLGMRCFISWMSCVQAAHRSGRAVDAAFFQKQSVCVYPVEEKAIPDANDVASFRNSLGIEPDETVFGRFSRPDIRKWDALVLEGFARAAHSGARIKLLLREPPAEIVPELISRLGRQVIILPATSSQDELDLTIAATDVILHTSRVGESFGYGIAEALALGKPVITHAVPGGDQAQIELIAHRKHGLLASTVQTVAKAILRMHHRPLIRAKMGASGRDFIARYASADLSCDRLETLLEAVIDGRTNPFAKEDLAAARSSQWLLRRWGHGAGIRDRAELLWLPFLRALPHRMKRVIDKCCSAR